MFVAKTAACAYPVLLTLKFKVQKYVKVLAVLQASDQLFDYFFIIIHVEIRNFKREGFGLQKGFGKAKLMLVYC